MNSAAFQACNPVYSTQENFPAQWNPSFTRGDCCNLHEREVVIRANFNQTTVTTKVVSGSCFHLEQK